MADDIFSQAAERAKQKERDKMHTKKFGGYLADVKKKPFGKSAFQKIKERYQQYQAGAPKRRAERIARLKQEVTIARLEAKKSGYQRRTSTGMDMFSNIIGTNNNIGRRSNNINALGGIDTYANNLFGSSGGVKRKKRSTNRKKPRYVRVRIA